MKRNMFSVLLHLILYMHFVVCCVDAAFCYVFLCWAFIKLELTEFAKTEILMWLLCCPCI